MDQNQDSIKDRSGRPLQKDDRVLHSPARPQPERMDAGCVIDQTRLVNEILRNRVVGQSSSIEALVCSVSRLLSGLRDPSRPIFTALLLGPTGVGKTESAKALAEALLGSGDALTQINAQEYAHGHELAKLLGSPPGYVGSNIEPLLSQSRIDQPYKRALETRAGLLGQAANQQEDDTARDENYVSVILFDEIEKAHLLLWNALLGILEDGVLTLGNNQMTDFTRSIILMTSNVGSREMQEVAERRQIGFRPDSAKDRVQSLQEAAQLASRHLFPAEFLTRFDQILVYSPLRRRHLSAIFDRMLGELHQRILSSAFPLLIKVSSQAKKLIIEEATDLQFGARPLRRAVESEIVDPVSRLIASQKVHAGDVVEVKREHNQLVFYRSQDIGLVA